MKEKVFKDSIHKYIYVYDQIISDLIDTPEFQRLARIKQLGLCYLAYHDANHTRFSHSLGVYEIVRKILDNFNKKDNFKLSKEEELIVKIAALLHDIGHIALSHCGEIAFKTNHEKWSKKIILGNTEVNRILSEYDEKMPQKVIQVLEKKHPNKVIVDLISSQLDADRMDYLLRDSLMTGVSYGKFDLERIIRIMIPTKDKGIVFKESGISSLEDYFFGRYSMYKQVYYYSASRSATIILIQIIKRFYDVYCKKRIYFEDDFMFVMKLIKEEEIKVEEYLLMDDNLFFSFLKKLSVHKDEILKDLSSRLINRNLFKCIKINSVKEKEYWKNKVEKSEYPLDYFYFEDIIRDQAYFCNEEKNPIYYQNNLGRLNELSNGSPIIKNLTNKIKETNIFIPKEII